MSESNLFSWQSKDIASMSIFREYKIVVVSLLALLIANGPPPDPPLVYAVTSTRKMDLNIVPKHHSYSDALCTIYRMQLEAEGKLSISWLAWLYHFCINTNLSSVGAIV